MKLSLLFVTLALLPTSLGGESEFERSFMTAKKLAQTKRWSQAKTELNRMLESHENESYMVARLSEVVELYRRCSFFESNPAVPVKQLIGGQLTEWNERTGQLGVTYSDLSRDFVDDGAGALVHPAIFTGPYTIEVHGRMTSAPKDLTASPRVPQILVAVHGRDSHQVSFGHPKFTVDGREQWIPPRILLNGSGPMQVLGEAASVALRFDTRFELSVEVSETTISASVDGRPILSTSKDPALFARVALLDVPGLSRVTLRGETNASWLNQLQDRAREEAWQSFRESWRVERELPAWIGEHLVDREAKTTGLTLPFQLSVTESQLPALESVSRFLGTGEFERGLLELERLSRRDLAPELRFFLKAMFELGLERRGDALRSVEAAISSEPEFFEARLLKGRILGEQGLEQEALKLFAEFVETRANVPVAWAEYASWCLRFGRPQQAQDVLASALQAGIPSSHLREVESLVTRAITGPLWEQTFEYSSRNFTVRSDVDRQTCFDAAQELEAALRLYQMRLDRIGSATRDRTQSPVYIFSGRAAYDSYAGDLFGNAPENTAGLFSPTLKQILVWIPEDPDELLKTLRHEGLHQFLDALLGRLPTWLNEGLAEYFENTERIRGVATPGRADLHHLRTLTAEDYQWIPYSELFAMSAEEFYSDSSANYAQSWAAVHWLQNTDSQKARLLPLYFKDLAGGADPAQLGETLLALDDLDRLVDEHIRKLARNQ